MPKLLFSMSLPMIVSMLIQALYNVVDAMFVSKLGENALAAVSLSYPFMSLMIAFGVGTGVGVNALISRYLGAKDFARVHKLSQHALLLPFATSILFTLFGIFFVPAYFRVQTSDPEIFHLGVQYLRIAVIINIGSMYQTMTEKLLSSTGKTGLTMFTQVSGAIVNIILDPIMIFGHFGLPAMGVAGAAWATIIGQSLAGILGIYLNIRHNPELNFSLRGFKIDWPIIRSIYNIAFPSILLPGTGALMTFLINNILQGFTSTATAIFGVYFNLQSFIFMPVFGLNNGMVPIVAYNFGAQKKDRIRQAIKISMISAVIYMLIGFAVFQFFPAQLLNMFHANEAMLEIGIPAFRKISLHFTLAGIAVIISATNQALGYANYSLINALTRQLIVLIPAAYLLGHFFGLEALWYAWPIAEIVSIAMSTFFIKKVWKIEELHL